MAANTFGPFGPGVNPTLEEPTYTDAVAAGVADTWFKPCVGSDPATGTKITARWLNFVLDNMRQACRGMGIPDNAVDKLLLLKAIQKADRQIENLGEGQPLYAGIGENGKHQLYSLLGSPGLAIVLDEETGEITLDLSPGAISIDNAGGAVEVYKGENAGDHVFRTIEGVNGITARLSVDENKVVVDGAGIRGEVTIRQRSLTSYGAVGWTHTVVPKASGNTVNVRVTGTAGSASLERRTQVAGVWSAWVALDGAGAPALSIYDIPQGGTIGTLVINGMTEFVTLVGDIVVPNGCTSIEIRANNTAPAKIEVIEYQYAA